MAQPPEAQDPTPGQWPLVIVAWLLVGIPLAWGVFQTMKKAALLFR